MGDHPVFWMVTALIVLFVVMAIWQSRIDRGRTSAVVDMIMDAEKRGTNRAVAQHPQIEPLKCIGCRTCIIACPEYDVIGMVNGVAQLVHASRCIGIGVCETACPVGAIVVGLGDTSERDDLPTLSSDFETSVPGIYIAGELSGIALIRQAIQGGTDVVQAIANKIAQQGRAGGDDGRIAREVRKR